MLLLILLLKRTGEEKNTLHIAIGNKENGIAQWRLCMWKLPGCKKGARRNQCPVSGEGARGHAYCFRMFQNIQLESTGYM
jgi:hypothetical protein